MLLLKVIGKNAAAFLKITKGRSYKMCIRDSFGRAILHIEKFPVIVILTFKNKVTFIFKIVERSKLPYFKFFFQM